MGLTLPGVLGRVFAAAGNIFQSSRIAGDTFDRQVVFGDGGRYVGDGTQDLTSSKVTLFGTPTDYIKMKNGSIGLVISGINDGFLRTLQEWHDYAENPIMSVGQVGGLWLNDNFRLAFGIFGPYNIWGDIYGHLGLSNTIIRASAGPPGNILTFADATGELFQRSRAGTQGSWVATNGTYANHNYGPGNAPTTFGSVKQWTVTANGNLITQSRAYPCKSNQFVSALIKTFSVNTARSKQLALVWLQADGVTSAGADATGTAATDNTIAFTQYTVSGVSPPGTAFVALKLTVTAGVAGEKHEDTCAGIWRDMLPSNLTAWSFPYCWRQDAFLPAGLAVTTTTGNTVSPIVITVGAGHPFLVGDTVTTTGIGGNTAANQVNATITAITSTTFTLAGTGNGAYTSGGTATMIFSATGVYDGAFAGDVYIRADGPLNVVQRFSTNATAGTPSNQKWVGDPRLTSQPAKLNWYGGTYLVQGASSNADYTLPGVAGGMLHNDQLDSVNRGVTSARLMDDTTNNAAAGGFCTVNLSVRKKSTGQPYVSKDGVFALFWGVWDLGFVTAAQGSGVMARMTGYSATPGGITSAFINTLRDTICHVRASVILPYTNAAFAITGGGTAGPGPWAYTGGSAGVNGTLKSFSTVGNNFIFTIPADFEGGSVAFAFLGAEGAFGGTVTWTGTAPGASGTTSTSNTADPGFRPRVVKRFTGLTAAHAGLTYIGTVSALDAGGNVNLDCCYIEGLNPNLVFVCGSPRLRDATAYVTLGNQMIGSSYWAGNSGATGDADVLALNASLLSLCGEFTDGSVAFVDMDAAIQKYSNYYFVGDGVRFDESGVHAMANQFVSTLNATIPLVPFQSINHDYHDTSVIPIGGPFTRQGPLSVTTGVSRLRIDDYYDVFSVNATVSTPPQGASVIVDVLKNGTTMFTTTANRPAVLTGTTTASSGAAPDTHFLFPGDYLTVNVTQVGASTAGADLTVNVLGRKIPIP